jgi:hypothetical protein
MSGLQTKLREDIESFGWHVLKVLPDEGHAPHAYSVGLFHSYGHPEIVIVGLPGDTAHHIINDIGGEVREGAVFEPGCRYGHLLDGFDTAIVKVDPAYYDDYFGQAIVFYGSTRFPVVQVVWPDRAHRFPWETAFDPSLQALQPVLLPAKRN